jgi:hypothetical protein
MTEKNKQLDTSDMGGIRSKWRTDDGINWDLIQRMRFMNADAEIDPEDSYSKGTQKFNEGNNT